MAKKEKPVREKPVKTPRQKPEKKKREKPVRQKRAERSDAVGAKRTPEKKKPAPRAEKKPPKEKAKKPGMLDKFKKNKNGEDSGLDIMTEVKEPFSIQGFFEEHVAEKFRRAKRILQDKGVIFFLFSPFQARGRLIAQMMVLVIGIMFGVVPRATSMVNALQQEAYASEIAGLKPVTVGSIQITPAASSNYKRMHMIALVISGKDLPSDPEKYEVHLARAYGASDWQDVTYSWSMYPVDDDRRIMLLAIDQTKQASGYGAFSLFVQLKDDPKVSKYAKESGMYEITLSSAQPTGPLYDKTGIHLSAISDTICGSGEIEKKQGEFQDALEKYQMALEQAEKMPIGVTVEPTTEDLETYCLANRVYRQLKDDSNTEDILSMEKISSKPELKYGVSLISGGIEYDDERVKDLNASGLYSEEEGKILTEHEHVTEAKDSVLAAMNNVNLAAETWYDRLDSFKLVLNQTIKVKQFPLYARVQNSLEDDIDFLDGEPEGPDEDGPGGPYGEYGGDDEPGTSSEVPGEEQPSETPTETPSVEEPSEEEPSEEEPSEEEPSEEEPSEEEPSEEEPSEEEPSSTKKPSETEKPADTPRPTYTPHEQTGEPADNK